MMDEAYYMLKTGYTVREIANRFYVSKSTVHKDLHERLKKVDEKMYEDVQKILDNNFAEKHIRGGMSTKRKYEQKEREL